MKQQLQSIAFQRVVSLQSQAQRLILFFYKNEAMHVDRSKNICQFMFAGRHSGGISIK